MRRFVFATGLLVLAALLGSATLLVWLTSTHLPSNHVGFDIHPLYVLCGVGLVWSVFGWRRGPARLWWSVVAASLLLAVCLTVLNRCDLLLDKELWFRRGMPEPKCFVSATSAAL